MKRSSLAAIAAILLSSVAFAQEGIPKPGPEVKKLEYFVGSWTSDADMKPGPMGPGGKITIGEKAEWMDGGFFVVIHSTFTSAAMGNGSGTAYMGYDPRDKMYTYDEFNSFGEATHSRGTFENDTWTWSNDIKIGSQNLKGRYTMKILSPSSYTYKFEVSPDGTTWNLVMDGKDTKK